MGPLTNIDEKGFASAAFHSFPDRMAFDGYTGDYGPNFFGHALNTATYLTHDDQLGLALLRRQRQGQPRRR